MAEFWAEWGALAYVAAAIWAFFEGETFVLIAAAAGAATGLIDPWILMFSVWGGSFAGDQLWFTLGRRYGPSVARRIPGGERRMASAARLLERYGAAFVLTFRFLYGVRNVASAACGAAGMPHPRFAVLNFIAAGIWAASFVAAGWYALELIGADNLVYALAGIGVLVLGLLILRSIRQRRRNAAAAAAAAVPPVGGG